MLGRKGREINRKGRERESECNNQHIRETDRRERERERERKGKGG